MGGAGSMHGEQKRSIHGFDGEDLREIDNFVDAGGDGRIILRWIPMDWDWEAWIGLTWLRMRTGGGRL